MSCVEVLSRALTRVGYKPHKEPHNSCQYPIVPFFGTPGQRDIKSICASQDSFLAKPKPA